MGTCLSLLVAGRVAPRHAIEQELSGAPMERWPGASRGEGLEASLPDPPLRTPGPPCPAQTSLAESDSLVPVSASGDPQRQSWGPSLGHTWP